KAEKVIAFHGKDASYAYNVLAEKPQVLHIRAGISSPICSAVWV
ncbi:hypothetical protein AM331_0005516, partial [Klebsiella pneumoniae]